MGIFLFLYYPVYLNRIPRRLFLGLLLVQDMEVPESLQRARFLNFAFWGQSTVSMPCKMTYLPTKKCNIAFFCFFF